MSAHSGDSSSRWWLPSLTQWLWLSVFLILLAQPWRSKMTLSDADVFMHWRAGDWMLEHRCIPRQELFTHTRAGAPFVAKEWLADVIFAAAGRWDGLGGMVVVAALIIASTLALLHRQLLREGNDILSATLAVLLAGWVSSIHWMTRPHVFSFLLFVLWHAALRSWDRSLWDKSLWERHSCRDSAGVAQPVAAGMPLPQITHPLITLVPLAIIWANLHSGFITGFFLLGAYWLGAVIERDWRKTRALTIAGAVALLATVINPNGWMLHWHNLRFFGSTYIMNLVPEFRSPNFHGPEAIQYAGWLAVFFATVALLRPRLRAGEIIVLLSWIFLAFQSSRNFALLALVAAPILTPAWSALIRERWRFHALPGGRGWLVVAAAAVAAVLFMPRTIAVPAKEWPVDAVRFIRENNEQFTGNMFNSYVWGSYLLHALPEHKVFVNSWADSLGEPFLREYQSASALSTNWSAVFQKYNVRWTLLPAGHVLNQALALAPGWTLVYSNETAMMFRRTE